ncbi:hypothetical protein [Rhizorhapis sp. SPR117]|uniref:hypothetical protein n=1 Tax=Rhizorhapis sp. SPR117 TaxID=2912611 RepID=UPI001F1FB76A|nr:hypothetical protein [Rhizorhapis sp. SPR117]
MKTLIFGAAVAAFAMLAAAPAPASAQADAAKLATIKCVWSQDPGPRAPLRRVCKKVADPRDQMTGVGGPECDPAYTGKTGRYVWRSRPQYGPRAPLQAPVRVWVDGTDVC